MKEENSQEIFGLNHRANVPKFGISINTDLIIQKILNQIQKKSKKEKKEQEQRKKNDQYKKQVDSIDFHNSHCTIQDIWQRFIDIQEELIKRRCAPISIIPEDIEIDNDKLCVTIDDNYNEQKIDSLLKGILGLDSYNLESGYILVDELKWDTMQEKELEQVIKGLSECYVELDTTPTINAIINYGSDIVRYDQLSIDELYQLDTTLKNGNFIKGTIDDTVAFISQIYIDIDGYMKYLFGDHYDTCNKKEMDQNKSKSIELLEYYNQYIPWDVMEQYSNIGLCCKHYTLIFKINNQRAKEELKNCYDCYFPDTDTFNFCRKFTKKPLVTRII